MEDNTMIKELPISVRSKHALSAAGIHTVGVLCEKTIGEVFAVHMIGRKALQEIMDVLALAGRSLKLEY